MKIKYLEQQIILQLKSNGFSAIVKFTHVSIEGSIHLVKWWGRFGRNECFEKIAASKCIPRKCEQMPMDVLSKLRGNYKPVHAQQVRANTQQMKQLRLNF